MSLKRPRILARAAKAGADVYRRDRDLAKLMPRLMMRPDKTQIIQGLRTAEAACEEDRKACAVTYSLSRHVGLLAALVAELRVKAV
ncbi:MAG: DUF6477 family protein [Pikeienuella sp.]